MLPLAICSALPVPGRRGPNVIAWREYPLPVESHSRRSVVAGHHREQVNERRHTGQVIAVEHAENGVRVNVGFAGIVRDAPSLTKWRVRRHRRPARAQT